MSRLFVLARASLLALFGLSIGCGGTAEGGSGGAGASSSSGAEHASAGPRLVRVSDADTTLYLFGTVHLLGPSTAWRDARIEAALASSRAIYFEVPTEESALVPHAALLRELAMNPAGVTLSSLLPPATRERVQTVAERMGVPFAQLEPMRPWIASITLAMGMLMQRGADPNAGVDRDLAAQAVRDTREVRYLEDIPTQLRAIGDLPVETQVELLTQSLDEIEETPEQFDALVAAWQRGDTAFLERELVLEMREEAPQLYDSMLVRRNAAWVEVLAAVLANEPGTFFVAAGAAHFVGPDAVQAGLAARGYHVN
jgi:uncharacterized protein YbaP (TraB family)